MPKTVIKIAKNYWLKTSSKIINSSLLVIFLLENLLLDLMELVTIIKQNYPKSKLH